MKTEVLTAEKVCWMREQYFSQQQTMEALARAVGCSITTARNAIKGLTWRNAGGTPEPAADAVEASAERLAARLGGLEPQASVEAPDPIAEILARRSRTPPGVPPSAEPQTSGETITLGTARHKD